jgi:hypothetical protein
MGANGMRRHAIVVGLAAAGVLLSVLGTGGGAALAATSGTIPGTLTAIPVSASYRIDQIFAGADGQMWFVTTQSQLGEISASGQATLTATALPHGTIPAQIAGAGPEGVWTFSNTYANPNANPPTAGACWIGLVTPDGILHDMALPAGPVRNQSTCSGAAADGAGNLWISLGSSSCYSDPCKVAVVAEMTPAGSVTQFAPARPGARPGAMALGSDGAMWILEGYRDQNIVRYTSAGVSSSIPVNSQPWASGLLALPNGMFWVQDKGGFGFFDSVNSTFPPGWAIVAVHVDPAAQNWYLPTQTGVDASGSLWKAGEMAQHGTGANRLFRLDRALTIGRTRSFPLAADGSQLLANGTVAMSSTGAMWAGALSGTGVTYLVRFQPLP